MYRKNTASQFVHFQGVDASTGGIKSGVSWTVRRCIDGTFAAAGGTATEDGSTGWYKFAMSQADTNGNDIAFNFTGTGAVPQTVNILTTAADPSDTVRFGLTALPNAAAEAAGGLFTRGSGAGQITQDANGRVNINAVALLGTAWLTPAVAGTPDVTVLATSRPGIRKNTALAKFEFLMTDSTNHNPATGLTVTVTRSIDGAAFAAGTLSAVTAVSNGLYYVDFGAGDLNGNVITLRCTATGADDLFVTITTSP